MADGKWIQGLTPEMAQAKAARHVLSVRLEVVRHWLPKATNPASRDPEDVHQLRVGTRRADAALRIFRSCLPGRTYRNARTRLRTLRRAAGAARDWDVFLIELRQRSQNAPAAELPGLDFLCGYAIAQRAAVQDTLEGVETHQPETFVEFMATTLEEVRPSNDDVKLKDLARPLLGAMLTRLHQSATDDLADYDHLHQVRIAGKRLRYALEVFADVFAPPLRERLYPMVEEMQETLGRANDSHVATQRLTALRTRLRGTNALWDRLKPGVEGLLRFHQRRLPQERRRFLKWWEQWCSAGAQAVLSEPAAPAED